MMAAGVHLALLVCLVQPGILLRLEHEQTMLKKHVVPL